MSTQIWPIQRLTERAISLPDCLVTRRAFDAGGTLDPATALLLPAQGAGLQTDLCDPDVAGLPEGATACAGLWMGDCFPVLRSPMDRMHHLPFEWVSNFPATSMFDDELTAQLSEVGLGPEQEQRNLAELGKSGLRTLLTIVPGDLAGVPTTCDVDAVTIALRSAFDLQQLTSGFLDALREHVGQDLPLVIHGGPEAHMPRAPETLSIDAILEMPS